MCVKFFQTANYLVRQMLFFVTSWFHSFSSVLAAGLCFMHAQAEYFLFILKKFLHHILLYTMYIISFSLTLRAYCAMSFILFRIHD